MFRQWLALVIIVLVYIPVAIDATVLHVAAPTLSMTLGASGNEITVDYRHLLASDGGYGAADGRTR